MRTILVSLILATNIAYAGSCCQPNPDLPPELTAIAAEFCDSELLNFGHPQDEPGNYYNARLKCNNASTLLYSVVGEWQAPHFFLCAWEEQEVECSYAEPQVDGKPTTNVKPMSIRK